MIIRKSNLRDIEGCAKISHIPEFSYLHKASDEKASKYLKEFYKKGILIVAEDDGRIIGFINGEFMLGSFVWVDGVTVKKEFRGKGIGKALFAKFREELKSKGVKHIYLMAPRFNEKTVRFYRNIGLKEGQEFVEFSGDI